MLYLQINFDQQPRLIKLHFKEGKEKYFWFHLVPHIHNNTVSTPFYQIYTNMRRLTNNLTSAELSLKN